MTPAVRRVRLKIGAMVLAVCACTSMSDAQVQLYLLRVGGLEKLSEQMVDPDGPGPMPAAVNPDNQFWIGSEPTAIAYGKGNLFVAGSMIGSALPLDGDDADGDMNVTEASPFSAAVVRVGNVQTSSMPTLTKIGASRVLVASARGYTGADYRGDVTGGQVVFAFDSGGNGFAKAISVYANVDGDMMPSVIDQIAAGTGYRGGVGPAFDFGPGGGGFAVLGGGPAISYMRFGDGGYLGMNPASMATSFSSPLYGPLDLFNPPGDPFGNTQHRDIDSDFTTGDLISSGSGGVRAATRNPDGSLTPKSYSPINAGVFPIGASVVGQHCALLSGFPGGAKIIWNYRPVTTPGQALIGMGTAGSIRAHAFSDGIVQSISLLNADATPLMLGTGVDQVNPEGNGAYDFAWEESTRTLVILDTSAKKYYLLTPEQPVPCCVGTTCVLLNPSNCAASHVGGVVNGAPGEACGVTPCQVVTTGRCCVGARCSIVQQSACAPGGGNAGAAFMLGASGCNAGGGVDTPCCFADYNKAGGVTVQDVFDFLTDWFAGSPDSNVFGDGVALPTVQDVFDFLTAWFAGCV